MPRTQKNNFADHIACQRFSKKAEKPVNALVNPLLKTQFITTKRSDQDCSFVLGYN